jgi:hypothetical protein
LVSQFQKTQILFTVAGETHQFKEDVRWIRA